MDIKIRQTGLNETLSIIDPRTGMDYISDFVGNTGAFNDGQFEYDAEQSSYLCDQYTFDWWHKVVNDNQELDERIYNLSKTYGSDEVYQVVNSAGSCDIEDHAANVNQFLDDAFNG